MSEVVPIPVATPSVVAVTVPGVAADPGQVEVSPIRFTDTYEVCFGGSGDLEVTNGKNAWIAPAAGYLRSVRASVYTAPVGADLVIRLSKNGTAWTTITITAGSTTAITTPALAIAAEDEVRVDITQVGSTTAGSDLTLALNLSRSS